MLVADILVNQIFRMYMKKSTLKLKKFIKLKKVIVIFVVVTNHKFLLSKRLEEKFLFTKEKLKFFIVELCQIQHGVI